MLCDAICEAAIDGTHLRTKPCKGYVPVYDATYALIASFKPLTAGRVTAVSRGRPIGQDLGQARAMAATWRWSVPQQPPTTCRPGSWARSAT
jgi:hypothetical protein